MSIFLSVRIRHLIQISLVIVIAEVLVACGDFLAGGAGSGGSGISTTMSSYTSGNINPNSSSSPIVSTSPSLPVADVTGGSSSTPKAIEEGNIYRNLEGSNLIVNLNQYRGVQLIDTTDVNHPKIIGSVRLSGNPKEIYQVGDFIYVLLNGMTDYRYILNENKKVLDSYTGAGLAVVNIANKSHPTVVQTQRLQGNVVSSRLTRKGNEAALYVALQADSYYATENEPSVTNGIVSETSHDKVKVFSYSINNNGNLSLKTALGLGEYVQAIAATPDHFMVSSNQNSGVQGSKVTLIDISNADGTMLQGATVQMVGNVAQKNNMDIAGHILRIVSSGQSIAGTNTNYVETFDIADIQNPIAIDRQTFGEGQQLYGTIFMPDRAFFVTYWRQDPLHTFSIAADGHLHEESSFVVSGWNDFFKPVYNNSLMIGVGTDDTNSKNTMSISLYDTSNLQNPSPLLARANVALDYSWSSASYDDKAFSVLENATQATAPDGTLETGMVLLPFSGWNTATNQYQSGVQLFTFSATTLTKRGVMLDDTPVQRSFMAKSLDGVAANLSDTNLSLFNVLNPDTPSKNSTLELSPNYKNIMFFGQYAVRDHSGSDGWYWWGNNTAAVREDILEIMPSNGDINAGSPVASINVPANSQIYKVNERLVVVSNIQTGNDTAPTYNTHIATWNMSNPIKPVAESVLDVLEAFGSNYIRPMIMDGINYSNEPAIVVGNALVFGNTVNQYNVSPYQLNVVDFSNPKTPILLPKMTMPASEIGVALVPDGNTLWINYKVEAVDTSDGKGQATYYIKALNLSNPSAARIGQPINIAGQLLVANGNTLYSKDFYWQDNQLRNSVNVMVLQGGKAYLQASKKYDDQDIRGILIDNGHVLVNHGVTAFTYTGDSGVPAPIISVSTPLPLVYTNQLSVLDRVDQGFIVRSTVDVFGTLQAAHAGKAIMNTGDGLLMYNTSNPTGAFAQAFFPARGWSSMGLNIRGNDIYYSAGRYGIYKFDMSTINLEQP